MKDVRGEIGRSAADPFPRDEDQQDDATARDGSPGSRSTTVPSVGV